MEQEQDGRVGEGGEPSQVVEIVDPGPNRVGSGRDGTASVVADLGGVGALLNPVVDEGTKACEWPDHTE